VKRANPNIFFTTVAYPIKNTPYFHAVADRVALGREWAEATDRDYAVQGRHSRRYYRFADAWLRNEVAGFRLQGTDPAAAVEKYAAAAEARAGLMASAEEVEA
jgi:hypothetical protein